MNKAFTLIELMVILLIVAIFTGVLFIDYGKNSKVFALDRASQKVAQDVRRAQEMAMSGTTGDASTNGYGVYFDKTGNNNLSYLIFRNNADLIMTYGGSDTVKETITIEKGVKICDLKDKLISSGVDSSVNNLSVAFLPPDPINYVGTNYIGHEASIILCIIGNESTTRTVRVNNAGKIEVSNP